MSSRADVTLDYNDMLASQVGAQGGVTPQEIEHFFPSLTQIQKALDDLHRLGQLSFRDLIHQEEEAQKVSERAEDLRHRFEDIVVLGIGGSGLGPRTLYEALCLYQPLVDKQMRPRFSVIDNVDPLVWQQLLEKVRLEKTLFIVISKSGTTIETLAGFSFFRDKLTHYLGPVGYRKNLVIITDPKKGPLRAIADHENIFSFAIPPGLGGRYSVLSSVGLFPAACLGIDIQGLLAGARQMDRRCQANDFWSNPGYLSGLLHYLLATRHHKTIRILMPYSEALDSYSEWFCQLWGESLGKRYNLKGKEIAAGQTPVRTMGTTDQHSQLQLYLEGPRDKVITFFTVRDGPTESIPTSYSNYPELDSLSGKTVHSLLLMEQRAAEQALRQAGVPSLTMTLPSLDAGSLGQLLYLAELETVVTGELYNINPFDQPAVETIKKYIKGLLGMKGFEPYKKELDTSPKNTRYII